MGLRRKPSLVIRPAGLALVVSLLALVGPVMAAGASPGVSSRQTSVTAVTIAPNPAHQGQTVTVTAKVTSTGGLDTPTGSVTFYNGSTQLGIATLDANGIGIYTNSSLPTGTFPMTAVYNGDSNYASSTSPVVFLQVLLPGDQLPTTTTLTINPDPAQVGQTITFNAAVSAGSGIQDVTGNVTFYNGSTAMATVTVTHGIATYQNSSFTPGSYSISAVYSGDSNYQGSTSPPVILNVFQAGQNTPTTTSLTINPDPAQMGTAVTFSARVSGGTGVLGQVTGTVTFYNGSNQLGTVQVDNNGLATLTSSSFDVGNYFMTAAYSGDSKYQPSSSPAVPLKINPPGVLAATTTTLTSSANEINFGDSVTFFASVGGGLGGSTPTGSVTFLDGATTLSTTPLSAGSASYTTDFLSPGTHPITAQYSGDANFQGSTSSVLNQIVDYSSNVPTYLVEVSPQSLTLSSGSSGTATVTVATAGGFNQQISFTCSGLPIYSTCSFSPASVNPDSNNTLFTSKLTVTTGVSARLRPGNLPFGRSLPRELATIFSTALFGVCGIGAARRGRKYGKRGIARAAMFLSGLCVLMTVWLVACGGSTAKSVTPSGTSTVTIAASSSSQGKSTTFTLTVK